MEITKDKVKRSLAASLFAGGIAEYVSAAAIKDFELFKNYKFDPFWQAFNSNLASPIETFSNVLSNEVFMQAQPILLGGMLFVAGKVLFNKPEKYEDASDYGAYGTSRWATASEIFNPANITSETKKDGTILGVHKNKLIIQHEDSELNRNICIVGGSGAGKTQSNIIPNILHNKEKSIVVIDPKGELYEKTSQTKREQGYEVHLVNFKNRDISDRYNLIYYIRRPADAFKIANILVNSAAEGDKVKKDFWNQAQISILQTFLLYVKYGGLPPEQQHMGSVFNLANTSIKAIYETFMEFDKDHIVRRAFANSIEKLLGNPKTLADVFQTLQNTLNPWQYDDVCHFTADNDFLFQELGTTKKIVYVIMPIADNEFRPLITTFFTQMFSELYLLADKNQGELPNNVILLLDEFANIGKIPNFEERLSTTRSLGIEVSIVLQDTSQLENRYGKDIAKEILNNCDIKLLLKTVEVETAKYFSQMAGKTTIRVKNKSNSSGSKSSSKSESVNYMGRDLITPDEIRKLNRNEELLFISGEHPMKVNKAWAFKYKYFKGMSGKAVSRDNYALTSRGRYEAFSAEHLEPTIPLKKEENTQQEKVLFIPNPVSDETKEMLDLFSSKEENESLIVDTETGEILDELSLPDEDFPEPPPPEEAPPEEQEDSLEDLMSNFKF